MKTTKFVKKIKKKKIDLIGALNFIDNHFKNDNIKNMFLNDLDTEICSVYLDVFSMISEKDTSIFFNCYECDEPPFILLDEENFVKIKHFSKIINGKYFISDRNISGFKNCENPKYKLFKFSTMLREMYSELNFFNKLDIHLNTDEYTCLDTLLEIDRHLYFKEATPKQKPELKIDQIALKYVYEGLRVTRDNSDAVAKEYGHNSGEKLFQRFTYYSSLANRTGRPTLCTPKKLDNKIKLIESVIELLHIVKQARAKDEVLILKTIYESEYQ